jgi:hypothetical protein
MHGAPLGRTAAAAIILIKPIKKSKKKKVILRAMPIRPILHLFSFFLFPPLNKCIGLRPSVPFFPYSFSLFTFYLPWHIDIDFGMDLAGNS